MAFDLDPLVIDPVPAKKLEQVNRNAELSISSPLGEVPTITFEREVIAYEGEVVASRKRLPGITLTAEEFVALVPEYKNLLDQIPKALDLTTQRLPDLMKMRAAKGDG